MRLNGSAINARRLNVDVRPIPEALAADAVAVAAADLSATRVRRMAGDAVSLAVGNFLASAQRYGAANFVSTQHASVAPSVVRNGSGSAIAITGGSLFYTRIVYWTGGAEINIIAVSDVGVVYGEGSGVMTPYVEMSGRRAKTGSGTAIAQTLAELPASAIRVPATKAASDSTNLVAQLDSAHITGGGVRYINGFGDAIGYLTLDDNGLKRQVFLGSLDLEPFATGLGSAVRNATAVANIDTATGLDLFSIRRGTGTGIVQGSANLAGEVLVAGSGQGVINLIAQLTGTVYIRGAVMEALSEIATELNGLRAKVGRGDLTLNTVGQLDGRRLALGAGDAIVIVASDSAATDYNFSGFDDDDEVFFRPAPQREFARPETTREWRRL